MAKRETKNPSKVFEQVLKQAEKKLLLDSSSARYFDHKVLRGGERAAALATFLRDHLPDVFGVGSGEAIDYLDTKSSELDIIIYDKSTAAPIHSSKESMLIPAESLYAVIEVKSIVNQNELNTCIKAANTIRKLRPFKSKFIPAPTQGETVKDQYRCLYFVFSYTTNLSADNWAKKELDRIDNSAIASGLSVDLIDRVFVLDRGILIPQTRTASEGENASRIFLDFYLHLMNFLHREKIRRPVIDWAAYASRGKWVRIR